MINGLTESENAFLEQKLIFPLKSKGYQVFLFGSRANGKYKKFSDIDLLYVEPAGVDKIIPQHEIFKLLSYLEESTFIYKVDLVKKSEIAKSYLDKIEVEKIEI